MRSKDIEAAAGERTRPGFERIAADFGCASTLATSPDAREHALVEEAAASRPSRIELDEHRFTFT